MAPTRSKAQLEIEAEDEVGESPVFSADGRQFHWVDITAGAVNVVETRTGRRRRHRIGTMVGAVALRQSGLGYAAALSDGFGFIEDGLARVVDPIVPDADHRLNDAKVDSRGRLWAGSTHMSFAAGEGGLHVWDGESPSRKVLSALTLPNGIGWSPDDRLMYVVDSMRSCIYSAEFDPDSASLGPPGVVAHVQHGLPDGLAVDAEGCLWVAIHGEGSVHRFAPDGRLVHVVEVSASQATSCAFHPDGRLFITTARAGLGERQLAEQPLAGSVFSVETGTTGRPVNEFAR